MTDPVAESLTPVREIMVTLPLEAEMMKRLLAIDESPACVEAVYPYLTRFAGDRVKACGLTKILSGAFAEFVGFCHRAELEMAPERQRGCDLVEQWVVALTDDEGVQTTALEPIMTALIYLRSNPD